jgi:SAM-dependent methyltransferase
MTENAMPRPSLWVERYLSGVAEGGLVLDLACGRGRHIALARELDLEVVGIDRDIAVASARFAVDPLVRLVAADLENGGALPFQPGTFAGVVVTNYLWRPILPDIVAAVAPGGLLIYETFRQGNERLGKPSRADFLLRPGELLDAVAGRLSVLAYEEVTLRGPMRVVERVCAAAPGHPWIDMPFQLDEERATR